MWVDTVSLKVLHSAQVAPFFASKPYSSDLAGCSKTVAYPAMVWYTA